MNSPRFICCRCWRRDLNPRPSDYKSYHRLFPSYWKHMLSRCTSVTCGKTSLRSNTLKYPCFCFGVPQVSPKVRLKARCDDGPLYNTRCKVQLMPLTCVAISWLLLTSTPLAEPAHWNRIESGPESVAVAEFVRLVNWSGQESVVESNTTDGALSVTNWQEICTPPLAGPAVAFAVITYDPDGNDSDNIVTSGGGPRYTAEQVGNKHEAEYACLGPAGPGGPCAPVGPCAPCGPVAP